MKLKARDVIEGWPKGRSTSSARDWTRYDIFWRARVWLGWTDAEISEVWKQHDANESYHCLQARLTAHARQDTDFQIAVRYSREFNHGYGTRGVIFLATEMGEVYGMVVPTQETTPPVQESFYEWGL